MQVFKILLIEIQNPHNVLVAYRDVGSHKVVCAEHLQLFPRVSVPPRLIKVNIWHGAYVETVAACRSTGSVGEVHECAVISTVSGIYGIFKRACVSACRVDYGCDFDVHLVLNPEITVVERVVDRLTCYLLNGKLAPIVRNIVSCQRVEGISLVVSERYVELLPGFRLIGFVFLGGYVLTFGCFVFGFVLRLFGT